MIRTNAREVVLDLVVRDKHHHAVTDLRPDEVQVFEDGAKQTVREFRNIQGAEQLQTERSVAGATNTAATPATSGAKPTDADAAHPLNTMRQVNFVSVVFAEIGPLNLEFARRAVTEFLHSDTLPNTYVTIYSLNGVLSVVQPFTSDKDLLAKAVETAAKGLRVKGGADGSSGVASAVEAQLQAAVALMAANPLQNNPSAASASAQAAQNLLFNPIPVVATNPLWAANAASQDVSVVLGDALITQADLAKALRFTTNMSPGMDSLDSLRQLVGSEEKLPGRKIVLYLADGITFPADRRDAVDNLISYANRSGVSFYTIDTRGLNTEDPVMPALAAQARIGAESVAQKIDPRDGHLQDDDVQLMAVSSPQLAMRELAESTGGFAVTNTNEIALPMQRMMEDIRTHYELVYSPTSTVYDGHFRRIEVRVSRPKITVQTRRGYFAVPDLNGEPLQPFELLALNAMNANPAPNVFPYQVAAMKFRPRQDTVDYELAFEVPMAGLTVIADPKTGKARVQAGLVAMIHDNSGQVVKKVSRELARDISSSDAAQTANARILYGEPVELSAGHYVIDTAVTDEHTGKTSVKRVSLFVDPGENLALSSLELVRRVDPLTGPRNPQSPFELTSGRITPTLADSVASGNPMSLYFIVYPAKSTGNENPKVTLAMMKDGREIARKPLALAQPEADGSIPVFVQLSPGPGQCDVLVTAQQGDAIAQASLSVKVQ